jgi:sterol desaturase/sphingolipid hydroxylase (fatty acid hydroxylase superfamily)
MNLSAIEPLIRIAIFASLLGAMAIWEAVGPRRERARTRWVRWPGNLALAALSAVLLRVLLPLAAVGVAELGAQNASGLINRYSVNPLAGGVVSVIVLDFALYLQHVVFHRVPVLWRLHRLHHADVDVDVTTGVRFHPLEILLSMLYKMALVWLIGASVLAVMVFEVLLSSAALFNHSNVKLASGVERILRLFIVTPDVHRVHHSVIATETNSNYGFNLIWWDRLLGTYRAQPQAGHERMQTGLEYFRDPRELGLIRMLVQPLREPSA